MFTCKSIINLEFGDVIGLRDARPLRGVARADLALATLALGQRNLKHLTLIQTFDFGVV